MIFLFSNTPNVLNIKILHLFSLSSTRSFMFDHFFLFLSIRNSKSISLVKTSLTRLYISFLCWRHKYLFNYLVWLFLEYNNHEIILSICIFVYCLFVLIGKLSFFEHEYVYFSYFILRNWNNAWNKSLKIFIEWACR